MQLCIQHLSVSCLLNFSIYLPSCSKHGKSHQQSMAVAQINTTSSSWSLLPHYIKDHEEMWIVLLHQAAMATFTGWIYGMCAY